MMNDMASKELAYGFVGPRTAWFLDNNTKIREVEKYHFDTTKTIIGKTVKGVTLRKVMGQYYKEDTDNSGQIGYPGFGDHKYDTWADRNKVNMMTHVDTDTYEWGLFAAAGDIGDMFMARTHENQKDAMSPYPHSWKDDELGYTYSSLQLGFGIGVKDFANFIVVNKLAKVVVA